MMCVLSPEKEAHVESDFELEFEVKQQLNDLWFAQQELDQEVYFWLRDN